MNTATASPAPVSTPPAPTAPAAVRPPDRILAIDAVRGFDMFWIAGPFAGHWLVMSFCAMVFGEVPESVKYYMGHHWGVFTPWDLIMPLFLFIVLTQIPLFLLAAFASGWAFYAMSIAFMAFVFGAIPFTDALIVRFVDDRMRSRVAGVRLAIAFGVSSLAVWMLGPLVKANGFSFLLCLLAAIAAVSAVAVTRLPTRRA